MRLSDAQLMDLVATMTHIPKDCDFVPITLEDIKMYFEYSERGMHKEKALLNPAYSQFSVESFSGFNALTWGKSWRDTDITIPIP